MMGNVFGEQANSMEAIAAYNNFLCTYGLLHTEMLPNDAIQCATRMWCNFTPEQQMSYAQMYPRHPNSFGYKMRSQYVEPPMAKLKVKAPANKCRTKIKSTPTAVKRNQVSKTNKRRKSVKPKAKPHQEPPSSGFREFFRRLRNRHRGITESEIVKKAARAWCKMNQREREIFLK
ncbi:uncharacterized protein LOC110177366 [Drosophila serrata]|uniref:uncharacterized protein LOC110177366 n=1 Tax=Drosophila serrata TaxID=7274 RepID=UPI000A1D39CB|nr:uncharacterized protein LOC110177366 [Drosophila serrata]